MRRILVAVVVLGLLGAAAGVVIYKMFPAQMAKYGGMAFNFYRSFDAPKGTLATEANPDHQGGSTVQAAPATGTPQAPAADADWPSYNRTLTSDRYSPLAQITTANAGQMKVLCTYDTGVHTVFETGLIMVEGALIGTTEFDIFSLDPATCAENWRTHEDIPPSILGVNRGAAYWDGMLFRGTQDGQVLAYDFKTGKRLWADDHRRSEHRRDGPGRPDRLGRHGLRRPGRRRLQGREGPHVRARRQDRKDRLGVLPRALSGGRHGPRPAREIAAHRSDLEYRSPAFRSAAAPPGRRPRSTPRPGRSMSPAATRRRTSRSGCARASPETPRTSIPARSSSSTPRPATTATTTTSAPMTGTTGMCRTRRSSSGRRAARTWWWSHRRTGTSTASTAPPASDCTGSRRRRSQNVEAPFVVGEPVRFCPGSVGGAEWNSPAYDPATNLILVGEVDWCYAVTLEDTHEARDGADGASLVGHGGAESVQCLSATPLRATRTGTAGSMPSTPIPASGPGGPS